MVFLRLVVSVGRHGFPPFRGTISGLWLALNLNVVSVPPQWSRDGGSCPIPVDSPSKWKKSGSLILWIRGLTDLINHGSRPLLIKIVQVPTDYGCKLWWWLEIWTSRGIDDTDIYILAILVFKVTHRAQKFYVLIPFPNIYNLVVV